MTPGPREGVHRPIRASAPADTIAATMTEPTATQHLSRPRPSRRSRPARGSLKTFFKPRSVALIGATEKAGSVGRTILTNLIASPFGGTVYPVNPNRPSILGIQCHPSIASIPEPVDLAVIVTPPPSIPAIIGECGEAGVPTAVVISAGFKEVGPEGAALELAGRGAGAPHRHARHRPQLPGRHEPRLRPERHVRRGHGQEGSRLLHRPERRAHHGHPRLEPARAGRLQLHRVAGLHGRRGLGRPHRLPGRRPATPTPSSSTWRPWATPGPSCRPSARWPWPSPSSS